MKKLSFLLLCSLFILPDISGQNLSEQVIKHEAMYDKMANIVTYFDAYPDSLLYDCARYVFNRTPLHLKKGYTDIYNNFLTCVTIETFRTGGWRGYQTVWRIRHDSLFIHRIHRIKGLRAIDTEADADEKDVRKRMEKFVGSKFGRRDVMFVDWISGDFTLLTRERPSSDIIWSEDHNIFEAGFIFTFEKGILKSVKKNMKDVTFFPMLFIPPDTITTL
jgi:hypothetical protein